MDLCSDCGVEPRRKHATICQKCHYRKYSLPWKEKNPDYFKDWYKENGDKYKDRRAGYRTTRRRRERELRIEALQALGGACSECKTDDLRVLDIHHVNEDGAEERRSTYRFAILRNVINCQDGYEAVCSNCHRIKHWGDL